MYAAVDLETGIWALRTAKNVEYHQPDQKLMPATSIKEGLERFRAEIKHLVPYVAIRPDHWKLPNDYERDGRLQRVISHSTCCLVAYKFQHPGAEKGPREAAVIAIGDKDVSVTTVCCEDGVFETKTSQRFAKGDLEKVVKAAGNVGHVVWAGKQDTDLKAAFPDSVRHYDTIDSATVAHLGALAQCELLVCAGSGLDRMV